MKLKEKAEGSMGSAREEVEKKHASLGGSKRSSAAHIPNAADSIAAGSVEEDGGAGTPRSVKVDFHSHLRVSGEKFQQLEDLIHKTRREITASLQEYKDDTGTKLASLKALHVGEAREWKAKIEFLEAETHDLIQFKARMNDLLPGMGDRGD